MMAFLLFYRLWAQDILIQDVKTPDLLFEQKLVSSPQSLSYVQFAGQPNKISETALKMAFKKAQFEFLQGSLEKAKLKFQEVADRQHSEMWSESAQKLIHFSLLRVAQLSPQNPDPWLEKAIQFHPALDIDTLLFPPPLVRTFKTIQKKRTLQVWTLPDGAPQFDQVFINGRQLASTTNFLRYRSGRVRLDFLSNKYQRQTLILPLSQLGAARLGKIPLAKGSCQSPQWQPTSTSTDRLRLVVNDCVSPKGARLGLLSPLPEKKVAKDSPDQQHPSLLRNKWFWIGASVLATGLAVHSLNRSSTGSPANPPVARRAPQRFTNN
jgi:hypothetical protein